VVKDKNEWFESTKETGWKKDNKASTRRWHLIRSTDKRKTMYHRYVTAGKRIQALANVTTDADTSLLANRDADYFFEKARSVK